MSNENVKKPIPNFKDFSPGVGEPSTLAPSDPVLENLSASKAETRGRKTKEEQAKLDKEREKDKQLSKLLGDYESWGRLAWLPVSVYALARGAKEAFDITKEEAQKIGVPASQCAEAFAGEFIKEHPQYAALGILATSMGSIFIEKQAKYLEQKAKELKNAK